MNTLLLHDEPTVFVVDQDPAIARVLKPIVAAREGRMQCCRSAEDLLAACDPTQPGCIFLDPGPPGPGWLHLFERLADEEIPLPVVVLSSHGDVLAVVEAMRAGALDFLLKPCSSQHLSSVLEEDPALGLRAPSASVAGVQDPPPSGRTEPGGERRACIPGSRTGEPPDRPRASSERSRGRGSPGKAHAKAARPIASRIGPLGSHRTLRAKKRVYGNPPSRQ